MNFASSDPALMPLVERYLAPEDRNLLVPVLTELGADVANRLSALADTADKNKPTLEHFDRDGKRVDRISYHPSYVELSKAAYEQYGLSALSHRGLHGWTETPPHLAKYALSYLFVQAEFGLACPVSMTDAAARTLRKFGDPELFGPYIDGLTSTEPESRFTGAMFMTETQAGTDIAMTETQAVPDGGAWRLSGKKWFTSNPDADVVLTLAKYPGGPDTTRGVGLFMLPKVLPDGTRNSYVIDRLKDKMGTRSMPSGEITLDGAYALQVGELDRGFKQMAEMINTSRLSNAMRSAALMRRAVVESVDHARRRVVFGKPLMQQPLMRNTILPLALEAEAALGLIFHSGDTLQKADGGDANAKSLIRVLTPIAKHYICKRARWVTGEAMEIRGGNGYIEDWPNSRLMRDSHLGSIWEGSSNVIALDVLRCMKQYGAHRVVADSMLEKLSALQATDAAPGAQQLTEAWHLVLTRGDALLAGANQDAQALIGHYTNTLAQLVMSTLLLEQAIHESANGYRKLMVANSYLDVIVNGRTGALPAALQWLDEIVDGDSVPREAALSVFK
ncbi:alkylation response protein AidB-like acyl-CoA dehydrogenase [Arthrobacter silviterrae]|uniref:Acyl-CoA dehydrogenase n=1 Tax=Arthrobacter silviterrae TaxID=2026658 RepID=A0ABX0DEN6_9MICC|nr:acyl-CoA dehydrogenase family protein [Arthrobacter silviterrae]MDQ0275936.1 alkylation response protein AidB-like acyl-CoA dehydrogenase [Arthrobacter silviterrae]NGN84186.1 acyl-CoA dehydrogenase [Arthrobacter silviterrae]